jgi:hypothetical protein
MQPSGRYGSAGFSGSSGGPAASNRRPTARCAASHARSLATGRGQDRRRQGAAFSSACASVIQPDCGAGVLTAEDLRGLTPLFWAHVLPYGEVKLNMTNRLAVSATQPPDPDEDR